MHRSPRLGALASVVFAFTSACGGSTETIEGWSEESHGKNAAPAYAVVFPQEQVKRFDLTIAPADWQKMQDDMTAMAGEFGAGGGMGPGGGGGGPGGGGGGPGGGQLPVELTAPCVDKAAGDACTATFQGNTFTSTCAQGPGGAQLLCRPQFGGGGGGGAPGGGGGGDILPNTPVYVPATFKFEGKTWPYIGVRMKGNSSLSQTWRSGVSKLPLRLSFDKFEDEHPETQDQRFYGFKTLSLGNGAADTSLMRDKIASDLFRESGVPAPRTAFVALYVDHGEGSQYWGLYTLDEDIDNNSLLDGYFGEHKGALYEADGTGARWGTFDEASFDIQANEEIGWTPVQEAINALHSDRSDAAAWRARLEQKLDVQGFLKWLAVNTVVQNWDAYGAMSHNYYLYAHSQENGRLHWITWDHDRSMGDGMGRSTSLTYDTTDATWPLIRYLLDDPTYKADYTRYALEAANGVMAPEPFQARLRAAHELITPWVVGENAEQPGYTFLSSPQAFIDAFSGTNGLLNFAARRQGEVRTALGAQP
ncbi:CotH kinase family protein [Cystobacter fuscus]|uniref:CotH kinase family protein n=1 Tax=Cystobacter fuscus TaxID=43 RepID=UPI002B28CA09|nr:cellulosomal protein [Cystobacter fuscus]